MGWPSSANPAHTSIRSALQHHSLRWLHTSAGWGCLALPEKALNQTSSVKAGDVSSASSQSSLPSPAPVCQRCFSLLPALWHQAVGGIPSQWQIPRARELSVLGAAFTSVHTGTALATSCLYSHSILSATVSTLQQVIFLLA